MIYGIILLYYENYADNSLINFKNILSEINKNHKIIAVTNNPDINIRGINLHNGDNSNSEFSGWDKGIDLVDLIAEDDFFIFCNDTFCHHRTWGKFEKDIFVRAFSKVITQNFQGVVGEVDTFREPFSIDGVTTSSWVSTYLFGVSSKLLVGFSKRLSISNHLSKTLVHTVDEGQIFWGEGVSNSLKSRIEHWLDEDNMLGWYKRNSSDRLKLNKIRSILNEMYLSANCQKLGFELRDVYSDLSWYSALRVRISRLARVCRVYASNFFASK